MKEVLLKLKLVLWKNKKIRLRHFILTSCEIIIPILLFFTLTYVNTKIDIPMRELIKKAYISNISYNEIQYDHSFNHTNVYYAPKTTFTTNLMNAVKLKLQIQNEDLVPFNSEKELITFYMDNTNYSTILMGVIFDKIVLLHNNQTPAQLHYRLRSNNGRQWNMDTAFDANTKYGTHTNYIDTGFTTLQKNIDLSFVDLVVKNNKSFEIGMQEFPSPPVYNDGFAIVFKEILPLLTLWSFMLLCPGVLKRIIEEKASGIKELMKMSGMKSWMLWFGWFLHGFVINIISIVINVMLLKGVIIGDATIPYTDCCILATFFVLYCCALICFVFALSTVFAKPKTAVGYCLVILQVSYFIPLFYDDFQRRDNLSVFYVLILLIFPNIAMYLGYNLISPHELKELGVQWNNLFTRLDASNSMTFGHIYLLFVFQILLYSFLTFYIDNVHPGTYGLAKKWNFLFAKCIKVKEVETDYELNALMGDSIETAPSNLIPGIVIRNLKKTFKDVNAVNDLSMDIYKDQITMLLGHNGAGKTTTMHILTGMISSTSGTININGYDIKEDMDEIRKSLGLCTQHNLLFMDLTVKEQLKFFCMLKGETSESAEELSVQMLLKLNLQSVAGKYPNELSGGMKRKVCLAIALVASPKVLLLDEPTTGLDPEARREVWDLLLSLRESRTILITTHFLEEADILGDRIAIMDHGNLLCYGTSMFLKKQFGTGYHLTLMRDRQQFLDENPEYSTENQVKLITDLVKEIVPDAETKELKGNCLNYMLPTESAGQFSTLFEVIEGKQVALGIISIGISVTTLDDVFMRVGSLVTQTADGDEDESDFGGKTKHCTVTQKRTITEGSQLMSGEGTSYDTFTEDAPNRNNTGIKLWAQQMKALMYKRFLLIKYSKAQVLMQFAVAILITFATVISGDNELKTASQEAEPPLNLTLRKLYAKLDVFYSCDEEIKDIGLLYKKLISDQTGIPSEIPDIVKELEKIAVTNLEHYKTRYAVAGEFFYKNPNLLIANAMYSGTAIHSAPISLNLITNAILQYATYSHEENKSEYVIATTNDPMPSTKVETEYQRMNSLSTMALYWLTFFPAGILCFTAVFVTFPLNERLANIKQLQLMTGVNPFLYWFSCYVCDVVLLYILTIILTLILWGFDSSFVFSDGNALVAFSSIVVMYGYSAIPFTYLFSYKDSVTGAQNLLIIALYFIGIICVPIIFVNENTVVHEDFRWTDLIKFICYTIPHFCFTYCCFLFAMKARTTYEWISKSAEDKIWSCAEEQFSIITDNPCCENEEKCNEFQSFFETESSLSIMPYLYAMFVQTFVYFAILVFMDTSYGFYMCQKIQNLYIPFLNRWRAGHTLRDDFEESDVVNEEHAVEIRINDIQESDKKLLVHKLKKCYRHVEAVRNVSFSVKPGECFGLLGVNGAGKSSTFKMLTCDEARTGGNAAIDKTPIDSRLEYLTKIGYCPQSDALNASLTAVELLNVFASLRGIPHETIEKEVENLTSQLGLTEYMNNPCKTYSGGNKRKLNIAIALIADPDVIFLDEPTSGVDPMSRRKLWEILQNLKRRRRASAFVLTSHSMEECETLCDRLTIMVQGQLRCIGEISYLKQKYQQGFTVLLKLKNDAVPVVLDLKKYFKQIFIADVKDEHKGLIHYHINPMNRATNQTWTWSELFKNMERLKELYPTTIEDYSLGDTTLEEIFLSFAREGKHQP